MALPTVEALTDSHAPSPDLLPGVIRGRVALPETGVEIATLDFGGDGPLALLLHANGFCAALWKPVAEALTARYHVVAMDARGHGDSICPELRAEASPESRAESGTPYAWDEMARDVVGVADWLLREHGERRLALGLGHSFGGTLSFLAAASRPGLFERLVLVDPVIFPRDRQGERAERRTEMVERASRRREGFASRAEARAFFASKPLFQHWHEDLLDLYVAEGLAEKADGGVELKCAAAVEAAVFGGSHTADPFGAAPGVRADVLLLRAARGNFPPELYAALADHLQRVEVRDIDAGHLAVMERPDLVINAVLGATPNAFSA